MELVKSEPGLWVKEEVVEESSQDVDEPQCVQEASAIVGSTNVFTSSADLDNILDPKEELGAIDIGPTVLQHMDTWFTTKQPDTNVAKQESTINGNNVNPIPCGGVEEETIEDECRDSMASHQVVMTDPGTWRTLPSLQLRIHKERLQSICRVQLTRLETPLHVKSCKANKQQRHAAGQRAQPPLYRCDRCWKTFKGNATLREHCKCVHGTGSHKCTECASKYKCAEYLVRHIRRAHGKQHEYECAGCKKMYKSKEGLTGHVAGCRKPRSAGSELRNYVCDHCQKTYKTKKRVQVHITTMHTNTSYKCLQCDKSYKCKAYLYRHAATVHSADLQYCNVCGKSIRDLRRHMLNMHYDKRCKFCAEVMKSKRLFRRHLIDCHGQQSVDAQHSEETQSGQRAQPRLYRCDKCPKTFNCHISRDTHCRNVHATGSHKCTECNHKFKCGRYLAMHIRRIHNKQRYECAGCKKIYKSKQGLTGHVAGCRELRSAESHPQFTCRHCGKNFKTNWNCWIHEKRRKCTRPAASNTSAVASTSPKQRNVVIVKEEPADGELELGPVVFQHMDCNYRPYKQEPGLD